MFPSSILSNFENNEKAATPPTNGTTINFGPKKIPSFQKKFGAAIKIFGKKFDQIDFWGENLGLCFYDFSIPNIFLPKKLFMSSNGAKMFQLKFDLRVSLYSNLCSGIIL